MMTSLIDVNGDINGDVNEDVDGDVGRRRCRWVVR